MKKILIASTYYENKHMPDVNKLWMRLQNEFIKSNTNDYDFAVYLNKVNNKEMYNKCIIIGENLSPPANSRLSHRIALSAILQYFRNNQDEYENFCILDSDCFPIHKGWVNELRNIIYGKELKFAAIMRVENGETFPHPSAIFVPNIFIKEDLFHFPYNAGSESTSFSILDGSIICDTGSACSFWDDGNLIGHPILRTNTVNVHPMFAGIYGDMFYHHGCGSRLNKKYGEVIEPDKSFRAKSYWGINSKKFNVDIAWLFDLIRKTPQKFINILRGNTPMDIYFPPVDLKYAKTKDDYFIKPFNFNF